MVLKQAISSVSLRGGSCCSGGTSVELSASKSRFGSPSSSSGEGSKLEAWVSSVAESPAFFVISSSGTGGVGHDQFLPHCVPWVCRVWGPQGGRRKSSPGKENLILMCPRVEEQDHQVVITA